MLAIWIFTLLSLMTISVFCLTPDEIEAQRSGWNIDPTTQYHIQTDEGPERYFRYQTANGQFRKEKRLADGTVIGTEGWLDATGFLRIKDYIADSKGYRILKSKKVYVGPHSPIQDAVAISRHVPAQSGILSKSRRPPNPFRKPAIQDLPGNSIESNSIKPYRRYNSPTTSSYPSYLSSTPSPITIDDRYNEIQKPVSNYLSQNYKYQSPYNGRWRKPSQSVEIIQQNDVINNNQYKENINIDPVSNYGNYRQETRRYRAAIASGKFNSTSRQTRGRKTNQQVATSRSDDNDKNIKNDNTVYYVQSKNRQARYSQSPLSSFPSSSSSSPADELPEYDGTHTNADGFQYYLKTHYHEEEQQPDKSVGSFGYVDPFGIRRVVYYKADSDGFVHKKNNRYVGFNATPYDPLPPKST